MKSVIRTLETMGQAYRGADFGISEISMARMEARLQQTLRQFPMEELGGWKKTIRIMLAIRFSPILLPRSIRFVTKPAAALAVFFGIAFIGWVTAMGAFSGVLPGDSLYGVKLASERAHLRLVSDPQNKAELEWEFASRRLDEIAKIAEGSYPDRNARAAVAAEQLKSQIVTAKGKLRNLRSTNQNDAVAVAKIVDRKVSEYQVTLDHATGLLSGSAQERVREAKDAAQDASFVAVSLLLEEGQSGQIAPEEIRRRVGDKLHEFEESIRLLEFRLAVLPRERYPEIEAIGGPSLESLGIAIANARAVLEKGKNVYAHGGFESALSYYREGIGFQNQLEWGIGLYEQALLDRAKAIEEKSKESVSDESTGKIPAKEIDQQDSTE